MLGFYNNINYKIWAVKKRKLILLVKLINLKNMEVLINSKKVKHKRKIPLFKVINKLNHNKVKII